MSLRLVGFATLSAPGRVCAELVRNSRPIGKQPEYSIIRPCPIFIEMACYINSARETVSRTINGLINAGILRRDPGALIILEPQRLQDKIN